MRVMAAADLLRACAVKLSPKVSCIVIQPRKFQLDMSKDIEVVATEGGCKIKGYSFVAQAIGYENGSNSSPSTLPALIQIKAVLEAARQANAQIEY